MPRKGRKVVKRPGAQDPAGHQLKEREQETVRLVNEALSVKDLQQLRKLSCVRGLVHHGLRERAWGTLCGADATTHPHFSQAEYEQLAAVQHRDRHVVRVDVERSLQTFLQDCPPEELAARRQQLERLINAAIGYHCHFETDMAPTTPQHFSRHSRNRKRHSTDGTARESANDGQGTSCLPSSRSLKSFTGNKSGRSTRTDSGASSFQAEASDSSRASFRDHEGASEQQLDNRRRHTSKLSCLGAPSTLSPSQSQGEFVEPSRVPQSRSGRLRGWGCLGGGTSAVRSPSYEGSSWADDTSVSLHTPVGSGSVADLDTITSRQPSVLASAGTTGLPHDPATPQPSVLRNVGSGPHVSAPEEHRVLYVAVPEGSLMHNPLFGMQSAGGAASSCGGASNQNGHASSMLKPCSLEQTETSSNGPTQPHVDVPSNIGEQNKDDAPATATAPGPQCVAHSHFDLSRYSTDLAMSAACNGIPTSVAPDASEVVTTPGRSNGAGSVVNGALSSADASLLSSCASSVQAGGAVQLGSTVGASTVASAQPGSMVPPGSTGASQGTPAEPGSTGDISLDVPAEPCSTGGASVDMPTTPDNSSIAHAAGTPSSDHQHSQLQEQEPSLTVRTSVIRADSDGLLPTGSELHGSRGLHASDSGRTALSTGEADRTPSFEQGSTQVEAAAAAAADVEPGQAQLAGPHGDAGLNANQEASAALKPASQDVYYYQGLHDIASVLLLVLGSEAAAFPLLTHLVTCQLRDATRTTLHPVSEVLNLMYPLLKAVDPELEAHLRANELPPFFALSWLITWFAHDVKDIQVAARLFDLFMSHHPLMPLYVGVAAMLGIRDQILACTEMPELHTLLVNINITQYASQHEHLLGASTPSSPTYSASISRQSSRSYRSGDSLSSPSYSPSSTSQRNGSSGRAPAGLNYAGDSITALIQDAICLFKKADPASLVKRHKLLLTHSVLPAAVRIRDRWVIPAVAPDAHKAGKVRTKSESRGNLWQRLARTWKQFSNRGRVSPTRRLTAPAPATPPQISPGPCEEEVEITPTPSTTSQAEDLNKSVSHANLGMIVSTGLSIVSVGVVYGLVLWTMRQGGEGGAGPVPVIAGVP